MDSLPLINLEELYSHMPDKMSEGEKKRISILRATVGKKSLILADEPDASLNQELVEQYINILLKRSDTLVVITHDQSLLSNFSRVISMEKLKA